MADSISFDEVGRDCSGVFCGQEVFEGGKIEKNLPLSATLPFALLNTLTLGDTHAPNGSFSTGVSLQPFAKTFLYGKYDWSEGMLNTMMNFAVPRLNNASVKIQTQSRGSFPNAPAMLVNAEFQYRNPDCALTMKCINDQVFMGSVMQTAPETPWGRFAAGTELMFRRQDFHSVVSMVGQWMSPSSVKLKETATISADTEGEMQMTYYRKASEQIALGTEISMNKQNSVVKFGYKLSLPQSQVRGQIDSNGRINTIIDHMLGNLQVTLCTQADVKQNTLKFGIGLVM